jgi:hypothetical protein
VAPQLVALSGHDSTPWTFDAFGRRFGDRYQPLRVGDELRIASDLIPPRLAAAPRMGGSG